jgi:cell division protein FtsL
MNPSKEARIQELKIEMLKTIDKIDSIERKIKSLEDMNEELDSRILELESR